jgi:hypothetical protein
MEHLAARGVLERLDDGRGLHEVDVHSLITASGLSGSFGRCAGVEPRINLNMSHIVNPAVHTSAAFLQTFIIVQPPQLAPTTTNSSSPPTISLSVPSPPTPLRSTCLSQCNVMRNISVSLSPCRRCTYVRLQTIHAVHTFPPGSTLTPGASSLGGWRMCTSTRL